MVSDRSCAVGLEAGSVEEAIGKLAALCAVNLQELSADEIAARLLIRELAISTAYDHGVALPHCRADEVSGFALAIAVSRNGIPFRRMPRSAPLSTMPPTPGAAPGGAVSAGGPLPDRTYLFLTLVGPADRPDEYIQVLSLLAQFALDPAARQRLLAAATPHQLCTVFRMYPHRTAPRERYVVGD